jgi:hypothetical protein
MSDQPYADAVAQLLEQGYRLESITTPEVVQQALNGWLHERIKAAIDHHAAITGNGHYPEDHCDAWYALENALTNMHDTSRQFVMDLLAPQKAKP